MKTWVNEHLAFAVAAIAQLKQTSNDGSQPSEPTNASCFGIYLVKIPLAGKRLDWAARLQRVHTFNSEPFSCGPCKFSVTMELGDPANPTAIGLYLKKVATNTPGSAQVHFQVELLDESGAAAKIQRMRAILGSDKGIGWPSFGQFWPAVDILQDGTGEPYMLFRVKLFVRRTFEWDMESKSLQKQPAWMDSPIYQRF